MDADGRIIPIVEDDQGEGFKDPLTMDDIMDLYGETLQEHREDLYKPLKHLVKKEFKKGQPEPRWEVEAADEVVEFLGIPDAIVAEVFYTPVWEPPFYLGLLRP